MTQSDAETHAGIGGARGFFARGQARLAALPPWALPAAVFAAAFVVRAWTLAQERASNPMFRSPLLDDAAYLRLAEDVRTGASAGRPWFLAPLYPWLLAAFSAGKTPDMESAERLSTVLGAATAALAAVAARLVHSDLAGWIAGALCAFAGTLVFHDVLPGQEPLLCLLHVGALLLTIRYVRRGGARWIAGALGVVAGLAVLGRSISASLVAAFVVVALTRVRPLSRAALGVGLAALGVAAVLVPAAIRNASATGDFTPLPWSGGPNLYSANGPESRRTLAYSSTEMGVDPDTMERRAYEIAETALGRKLRPSEVSAYWVGRTWDERGSTGELLSHVGRKALFFWNREDVGSNHDADIDREWSTWLGIVPTSAWWILALGVAGWCVARPRAPELDFAAVAFVVTWAGLAVFYPLARYKLPLVPLAAACAAAGAAETALRGVPWRRGVVAALVLVAAVRVSGETLRTPDPYWSLNNVAYAFEREGNRPGAIAFWRRLLARSPQDGWAMERIGRLLIDEGRPAEALPYLLEAKKDPRTSGSAAIALVYALVVTGSAERAEAEGRELLEDGTARPELRAELLANMSLVADARGDSALASERLNAAASISPDAPAVRRAKSSIGR